MKNMPVQINFKRLSWALLWCISLSIQAGVEPELKNFITGSASLTAPNPTLVVYDQVFLQSNGNAQSGVNPADWHLNRATNMVSLAINQETVVDCGYPQFAFSMEVRIEAKGEDGVMLAGYPRNVNLSVDYDNILGAKYTERHSDTFSQAFYTQLTVINISDPVFTDFVKLETRTEIERYKDIDLFTPPIINPYIVRTNDTEIEFLWDAVDGAEEYDFEWTYVDDYALNGGFTSLGGLNVNFDNDATRVSIKKNHYKISQSYEHGYIAVRVRAVGLNGESFTNRVNGAWTYGGQLLPMTGFQLGRDLIKIEETVVSGADAHEHEPKLTWQYSSVYAEEGKKKEVIAYFDGTQRNRQSVTKVNTDEMAIVGESVYDHVGRMAVNVLPVPAMENKLQYYANFNRSSVSGENYHYSDFEVDNGSCLNTTNPMGTQSGASQYYSSQNPLVNTLHYMYLPNAGGYPFSVTEYEPDGTGRVRRQGGVGPYHQLNGLGHETKYYYGTPDQPELDRMFGSAVGHAQHYQKEMVVDPNGQVSISYKDLSGNVIATALAGDNPNNTAPLGNMTNAEPVTYSLLSSNNSLKGKDFIQTNKKFTVAKAGQHILDYTFDIPRYTDALRPNLCFDCVYELTISLMDECGVEQMPNGQVLTRTLGKPLGNSFDTDCESGPLSYSFTNDAALSNSNITTNLKIGSYTLVKTLRINQQAIDFYEKEFLTGPGIKTEQEFINEMMATLDTTACNMTCTECLDRIGTLPEFLTTERAKITDAGGTPDGDDDIEIQELYNVLKENCDALCDNASFTTCDAQLEILKADVSPGGQFANIDYDNSTNTTTYGGLLDPNYLFNGLGSGYYSQEQVGGNYVSLIYLDESGNPDQITINGVIKTPDQLTQAEFVQFWKPSWAGTLVKLHPEYCRYEACAANTLSEEFDQAMLNTETYAEALTKGYLNPLNTNSSFTYVAMDPYFTGTGSGVGSLAGMTSKLNAYQNPDPNGSCRSFSAWELPLATYVCKSATCSSTLSCLSNGWNQTSCAPYLDRMWHMFRALYLAEKETIKNSLSSNCSGSLNGRTSRYVNHANNDDLLGGDPNSRSSIENYSAAQLGEHCKTVCEAQADAWMQKLVGCNLTGPDSIEMRTLLINVCARGCDKDNALGASTVAPDSILNPGLNSFKDVFEKLKSENKLSHITGICDIYLLEDPRPYGHDLTGGNKFSLDKCEAFWTKHVPTCVQNETDLEIKKSMVFEIIAKQDSIECKDCINCQQLFNGVTALLMEYGAGFLDTNANHQKVAGNFLNNYFGFNLSYADYAVFAKKCLLVDSSFETTSWLRYYYDEFWSVQFPTVFNTQPVQIPEGMGPVYDPSRVLYASLNATPPISPPPGNSGMIPLDTCGCNFLSQMQDAWDLLPPPKNNFNLYVEGNLSGCEIPPGTVNYQALLNYCSKAFATRIPGNNGGSWKVEPGTWNYDQTAALKAEVKSLSLEIPDCIPCDPEDASSFIIHEIDDDCPIDCGAFIEFLQNYESECGSMYVLMKQLVDGNARISDPSLDTNCLRQMMVDFYNQFPDVFPCPQSPLRQEPYSPEQLGNRSFESFIEKYRHCLQDPFYCNSGYWPAMDDTTCCMRRNGNDTVMHHFLNQMTTKVGSSAVNQFAYNNYNLHPLLDQFYNTTMYDGSACSTSLVNNSSLHRVYANSLPYNHQYQYRAEYEDGCGFNSILHLTAVQAPSFSPFPWITSFDSVRGYADGCTPGHSFRARAAYLNPLTNMVDTTWICGSYSFFKFHETCQGPDFTLCNRSAYDIQGERDTNPCIAEMKLLANYQAKRAYAEYMDSLKYDFRTKYVSKCREAGEHETFTRSFLDQQYHYTLYYYDQSGNLEQTVPPLGVQLLDQAQTDQVGTMRKSNSPSVLYPTHELRTTYRYNTLNQMVWQTTPDGGESQFWYDNLGRMVVSQNAEQNTNGQFSYTQHDGLGRIVEVGQVTPQSTMTTTIAFNPLALGMWHSLSSGKDQITKTVYDEVSNTVSYLGFEQNNLRTRVASMTYQESSTGPVKHAVHYTYDLVGNVTDLVREVPELAPLGHAYKLTHYAFDLVSGKVNKVTYQPNQEDQFIHQYSYDADNRLTETQTSTDGMHWDLDAYYEYYLHGALKRTELGGLKVQGMDYVYNLQGWLKGVNGTTQESARDVGQDGEAGTLHEKVAKDAFGFSLSYHTEDHEAIGLLGTSPILNTQNHFIPDEANSDVTNIAPDLWNGNIKTMVTAISKLSYGATGQPFVPMARSFNYDQLNRLVEARSFNNYDDVANVWETNSQLGGLAKHKEKFSYDANGNVLTLNRWGVDTTNTVQKMDSLDYFYNTGTNQLDHITDDPTLSNNFVADVENQTTGNYSYDGIGNMVQDLAEEIQEIKWTVYGKIKAIMRTGGSQKQSLEFEYGPDGHRAMKKAYDPVNNVTKYTLYSRDAAGNIMATYASTVDGNKLTQSIQIGATDDWVWQESSIYGSSRVGVYHAKKKLSTSSANQTAGLNTFTRGKRAYELSNHLGNVLAIVSDKRSAVCNGGMNIAHYLPEVLTAMDYYAFGMQMPDRTWNQPKLNIVDVTTDDFNSATKSSSSNAIDDGNERWYAYWPGGGAPHSLSLIPDGSGGQKMRQDCSADRSVYMDPITLIPGETYSVSFDLDFVGVSQVGGYVRCLNALGSWIYVHQQWYTSDGSYGFKFTVPDTATGQVRVHFSAYIGGAGIEFSLDNFKIFQSTHGGFGYRYGFNGYEREDKVAGAGSFIDFGARIYDSRLGRFLSKDPINYPFWSPYQYDGNSPVSIKDIMGMGPGFPGPPHRKHFRKKSRRKKRSLRRKCNLSTGMTGARIYFKLTGKNLRSKSVRKRSRRGRKRSNRRRRRSLTLNFSFNLGFIKPVFTFDIIPARNVVTFSGPDGGFILTPVRVVLPTGFISPNNNGQSTSVIRNPFNFSIPVIRMYWQGKITRTTVRIRIRSTGSSIRSRTRTTANWGYIPISPLEWMINLGNMISNGIGSMF